MPDIQAEEMGTTENKMTVSIEYYTDPLCSWSWAFEAQWRHLRYEYAGQVSWRYRMGGLIPDWQSYDDPFNDIRNPLQMGPQWFQIREMTGMPMDERIWQIDPPASSYPACIAVKAAELQGQAVAEAYLRRLREAMMIERRNIARREVLLTVAQEMAFGSTSNSLFDLERFQQSLDAPETINAFRQDVRDAAYYDIGRFPTLILHPAQGQSIMLVGYRPYDVLQAALKHVAPGLEQRIEKPAEELAIAYVTYWQHVIAHELVEVTGGDTNSASALLESLVTKGMLAKEDAHSIVPIYTLAKQQ